MKGQKVATVGRGSKREKKNGGVVDAGISASPNPCVVVVGGLSFPGFQR